ncbi:MAG: hypothetical protein HKL95_10585, partial [Phycisphaerae bacterium]|nr:hypothetical protein [Phycisphaerae bacterium]
FISPLKPDQTLIIVAFLGLFVGTVLWLAGFRMARPALTMVLAALGGFCGYLAPLLWHWPIVNFASAIILAIIGALLGSIGFRLAQATLVAGLVAVTILSAFAMQHRVKPPSHSKPVPHRIDQGAAAPTRHQPDEQMWRIWHNAQDRWSGWWQRVVQLPRATRNKAQGVAFGSALVVLLLGWWFWRATCVLASACVGTVVLGLSLAVLGRAFAPQLLAHWLEQLNLLWLVLGTAIGGILLQVAQVWHQAQRQKKEMTKKPEAKKAV